MSESKENLLGTFLRDRRARLDPAVFGLSATRRRTPGLRREEVAQRAHVSATWYTWLEQGRGGAPSAGVLERLAAALLLDEAEREHLFLLALGRPPERPPASRPGVSPRLQRVLDALPTSPALVRNVAWDVVAWNEAAAAALTDYEALEPARRNILRIIFDESRVRARPPEWEEVARFVVAAFRADAVRAGMPAGVRDLVDDLRRTSAPFDAMWQDNEVRHYGEGTKLVHHREVGPIAFEYSSFSVDGEPGLGVIVYTPAGAREEALVRQLVDRRAKARAATHAPASLPA